jgi:protein-S-isoprenylcysteine O-methyltransferase Ste14
MMIARPDVAPMTLAGLALRCLRVLAIFALLLFVPAGTLAWPGAWVFLAIMAVASFGGTAWLARHDPALLKERMRPPIQRDQKSWDRLLMGAFIPLWLGWFVLMGLDKRFSWSSPPVPVSLQALGVVLIGLTLCLGLRVLQENSFAAPVVKIQKERGHRVVTSGPYAYVRHPMYASAILLAVGVPLLLGSWWGLCVAPNLILLLALRAVLEERMLKAELEGYADYAARVRYRLVPLVW